MELPVTVERAEVGRGLALTALRLLEAGEGDQRAVRGLLVAPDHRGWRHRRRPRRACAWPRAATGSRGRQGQCVDRARQPAGRAGS